MESEYKKSHKVPCQVHKSNSAGMNWPTDPLFLPLLAPQMKKMLIFWTTNRTISSSIDANSTFGNIAMC